MSLHLLLVRLKKLFFVLRYPRLMKALMQDQLFATVEHEMVIGTRFVTIVDVGANKGQFALACRVLSPTSNIISFEPLPNAADNFEKFFHDDQKVKLYRSAIGPFKGQELMHISARDDSSSILPMGEGQTTFFPGTQEVGTANVEIGPLDSFVRPPDVVSPALLKIDVQGYEYEVLMGCESLIQNFDQVYCECSFVELYTGQKLADSVIDWLAKKGFRLSGVYNVAYDQDGKAIQADFLFDRSA